jgi:hypothetical protein
MKRANEMKGRKETQEHVTSLHIPYGSLYKVPPLPQAFADDPSLGLVSLDPFSFF